MVPKKLFNFKELSGSQVHWQHFGIGYCLLSFNCRPSNHMADIQNIFDFFKFIHSIRFEFYVRKFLVIANRLCNGSDEFYDLGPIIKTFTVI